MGREGAKPQKEFGHEVARTEREKPSGKKENAGLEKMTRHTKSGKTKRSMTPKKK